MDGTLMSAKEHPLAVASDQWRAKVVWTRTDGTSTTRYEGPYLNKHTAKGRISFWRSFFEKTDHTVVVTGRLQVCKMDWTDIENE